MQGYMDKVTKSLKLLGVGVVLFVSIVLPSAGRNVGNAYDTCFPASMREGILESLWEGPHGLLSFSQDNGLEPPMIHSKWYVDGLCGGDDGRLEAELWAREFGRAVAQMLDEYGRSWKTILRQEERVGAVEDLLDLADWFFQKPGYGNGLLFFRLQDLALAQICHLLCDMSIPVGTVAALMDRMVGYPDSVELGAKVLREECPEAGFPLIDWQEEESIRWNPVEDTRGQANKLLTKRGAMGRGAKEGRLRREGGAGSRSPRVGLANRQAAQTDGTVRSESPSYPSGRQQTSRTISSSARMRRRQSSVTGQGLMSQISRAYSAMVRSVLNLPECAMLCRHIRAHAFWSRNAWATFSWQAT